MLIILYVIYKIIYSPGDFINYMRSKFFKENYKKINKNLCLKLQERQITVETVCVFCSSYSGNDSLDISVLGAIQCLLCSSGSCCISLTCKNCLTIPRKIIRNIKLYNFITRESKPKANCKLLQRVATKMKKKARG